MNLRDAILREHSKANTTVVAKWVGDDKQRFDALMDLFLKGEYRVTQRAAWIVSYCAEANPKLIQPYIGKMIKRATKPDVHVSVARNVARVLQFVEIPKKDLGNVVNFCFNALVDPSAAIAVQAHAMTVLTNVCKREPELKRELRTAVEALLPNGSAGIKSRARKTLAQLEKI